MAETMRAMQLKRPGGPLHLVESLLPIPTIGEALIRVLACGVCRTDIHVADGDIASNLPIVPGHEIVGHVQALGPGVTGLGIGDRIGIPWLGHTCGKCSFCLAGRENLCDAPGFTGCTRNGGFATHCIAEAKYCLKIPESLDDIHAAPLLCAGLIGYRALRKAGPASVLGLYGFGAAAHIIAQVARCQGREVFAFTRESDEAGQAFARSLGCAWAGTSSCDPPKSMDAAIIFAPDGRLIPEALRRVKKGGRVVCAGIHMSDIPRFPYADLWGEREIVSVANLTRADGAEFLALSAQLPLQTHVTQMPLAEANRALDRLRSGDVQGALVLVPENSPDHPFPG